MDTIEINQTRVTDFYRFIDTDFYPFSTPRIERKSWQGNICDACHTSNEVAFCRRNAFKLVFYGSTCLRFSPQGLCFSPWVRFVRYFKDMFLVQQYIVLLNTVDSR